MNAKVAKALRKEAKKKFNVSTKYLMEEDIKRLNRKGLIARRPRHLHPNCTRGVYKKLKREYRRGL